MKKVMFIMAAALLMMTQCKKENETPTDPAEGTVKMTVTAGPGRTGISTETGAITWSEGDELYVSNGTEWLGSLSLQNGAGTPHGTFTGSVTGLDDEGVTCHFFYLGKGNIATTPTGTAAVSISLASQDGTLAGENGAMKYHIGYGTTNVTVQSGEYQGNVLMSTKIAIAHINFTTDGTTAYTGAVTMGGTGISNTLSVSPGGTFSGSGEGGIVIGGTTGERYVTLIPTETADVLNVAFTGDATGSMTFAKGINENKFYGMKNAIAVTLEATATASKFSVGENTTVEFAPGNLYWDGSAFQFEADQWSFADEWNASHVSHFFWSKTASEAYAEEYDDSASEDDFFFTNSGETAANSDFHVNGETDANQWRMLSEAEWRYLLGIDLKDGEQSEGVGRPNAMSLCALVTLTDVNVYGLVILPDGSSVPASDVTTTDLVSSYGAVFLPAAGDNDAWGEGEDNIDAYGRYWTNSFGSSGTGACCLHFDSEDGIEMVDSDNLDCRRTVRLVR